MSDSEFFESQWRDLCLRTVQHLGLCGATLAAACLVAVPAGIVLTHSRRAAWLVLSAVSAIQTIPSLALLAFLMVLTGQIGYLPSVIALFLYSLLPILQTTYAGVQQTPQPVRHAAMAMGMTQRQILFEIDLPLALPVVMAGLRTAAVGIVGTATLCAFIGAGGLGVFINRGIESVNTPLVLLGVVPVAILALTADWSLARLGRALAPRGS